MNEFVQSNTMGRNKPKEGNYKESSFWKLSNVLENNKKLLNYDSSPLKDMLGSTAHIMQMLAHSHGYLENEILLTLGNFMIHMLLNNNFFKAYVL